MPIEGKTTIKSSIIRKYADKLRDHLYDISYVVESLQNMGWYVLKTYGTMYYLEYCKFDISLEEARRELEDIGIVNNVIVEELNLENAY